MPRVEIDQSGGFDVALRRFKRLVEKSGIPSALRRKERYEKPAAVRKRKKAAAVKRYAKKIQKENEARERERTRY